MLVLTSKASRQGWAATCNRETTHGIWSAIERNLHIINVSELLAALFVMKLVSCSSQSGQRDSSGPHQQDGGSRSVSLLQFTQEFVELLPWQGDHANCRAYRIGNQTVSLTITGTAAVFHWFYTL